MKNPQTNIKFFVFNGCASLLLIILMACSADTQTINSAFTPSPTLSVEELQANPLNPTWSIFAVDNSSTKTGMYNSVMLINGRPAITYWSAEENRLKYVQAQTADGTLWKEPLTISDNGGQWSNLSVINGYPAIVYTSDSGLQYVRANDIDGSSWGKAITLTTPSVSFVSFKLVNNYPAIGYVDEGVIKYIQAKDYDGLTWHNPITVVPEKGDMVEVSLAEVNSHPALSYYDLKTHQLNYIRATDVTGSLWEKENVVQIALNVFMGNQDLTVVNGLPALSYFDATYGDLRYIQAKDVDGQKWGMPIVVAKNGWTGVSNALTIVNNRPVLAYTDEIGLQYVEALDNNGSTWGTPILVSTGLAIDISLKTMDDKPILVYCNCEAPENSTLYGLMYATLRADIPVVDGPAKLLHP